MIKLTKGCKPEELTDEVIEELTQIYIADKEKDVWNSPKIKEALKRVLMESSNRKCVYCECQIGTESKDVTIDHFKPKVDNACIVVDWDNLVPSCLRCNRTKNRKMDEIINPFEINPKNHIAVNHKKDSCLIKINDSQLGENTIDVLDLNDIERVRTARFAAKEKLIEALESKYDRIKEGDFNRRTINQIDALLNNIDENHIYAGVLARNVLDSEVYDNIKNVLVKYDKWTERFKTLEIRLNELALPRG